MRILEQRALKRVEVAKAALERAHEKLEAIREHGSKRKQQVQVWAQRRGEIAAAVRDGATAATLAKTYGLSRARGAQLFYRAQRDLKPALDEFRRGFTAPPSHEDPPYIIELIPAPASSALIFDIGDALRKGILEVKD